MWAVALCSRPIRWLVMLFVEMMMIKQWQQTVMIPSDEPGIYRMGVELRDVLHDDDGAATDTIVARITTFVAPQAFASDVSDSRHAPQAAMLRLCREHIMRHHHEVHSSNHFYEVLPFA